MAVLGVLSSRIIFDNSRWLFPDDPAEILKNYTGEYFDQQKEFIVAISLDRPFFSKEVFLSLIDFEKKLKEKISIKKISHPLNISFLLRDSSDALGPTSLKKRFIKKQSSLDELKDIFRNSFYQGRYMSSDFHSFLVVIVPEPTEDAELRDQRKKELNDTVVGMLKQHAFFSNFKLAGEVKLDHELNHQNILQIKRLIPIIFLFMAVFLGFYYSSFKAFLIVIFSSGLTLVGSISVFYLLGIPMNMLTSIVPLLITAIAISDSIHIIGRYSKESKDSCLDFKKLMMFTWKPCFITSLTTSIGFLSFFNSKLLSIQELSLVAPVAVLFSYVLIMGSNWSLLYLLRPHIKEKFNHVKILSRYLSFKYSPIWFVTVISFLFLSVGVVYSLAHVETNLLDSFFKKESQIQRDFSYIDRVHGGTGHFDLIVGRQKFDLLPDFKDINTYNRFLRLEQDISTISEVKRMESYGMPVQMVHQELSSKGRHPATTSALAQEMLFLEFSRSAESDDLLRPFLTFDNKVARFVFRTQNLSNLKAQTLKEELKKYTDQLPWKSEYSGTNEYFLRLSKFILGTKVTSLVATLLAISVLMMFFYNLRASLVTVLINLIPICVTMLGIVLTKTPFDFSTVLISSICLGISVDNSIHLIHYMSQYPESERKKAFLTALVPVGLDSFIFVGVFAIFATSSIVLFQRFGLFGGLMAAISLIVNIFLVPLLYRFRPLDGPARFV